jgi:hypothetical protein
MAGRGNGTGAGSTAVAIAALAFWGVAAIAGPPDGGKGRGPMNGTGGRAGTEGSPIPAIDRQVPAEVETATFALG